MHKSNDPGLPRIDVMELIKKTVMASDVIKGDEAPRRPVRKCQISLRVDCSVIEELEWAALRAGTRKTTLAAALLSSAIGDLVSRMREGEKAPSGD